MHQEPSFGERLRRHRIAASLTQEALAERAGLSVRGISDLERGINTRPRLETVRLLADALGLSASERADLALSAQPVAPPAAPRVRDDQEFAPPPVPPTSLLGRESELATICGLLRKSSIRLVTLTGPGGIGKTRLAHAVMLDLAADFADGVRFISLAAIRDPALVVETIAQALGLPDSGDQSARQRLLAHLRTRHMLLVLDNFEQLLAAAPHVADVLAHCPALTILVTSRAALRLSAEQEWPVPPLVLPDAAQTPDPSTLDRSPAVALFVQRARAVDPAFHLDANNASTVATLCARLDGLPLAIELAAARVKLLPPQAMLARMADSLPLLAGGPRDQPSRQQTLRNTIAWSYDLLTPTEQALFAALSVFVGGWTLAAAAAVYAAMGGDASDVLEATAALVDHNLIRRDAHADGEPRFGMLETIREYARERLVATGREDAVARAHCTFYLALAGQFYHSPFRNWAFGTNQAETLALFEAEHDNLRATLAWALEAGEARLAVQVASVTKMFWQIRGYLTEGRRWFEAALAQADDVDPMWRAGALDQASHLIRMQGDYAAARVLAEESLAIWRVLDDKRGLASVIFNLARVAQDQGDYAAAKALHEESLALVRELGDKQRVGFILVCLGEMAQRCGEYDGARDILEESLLLLREAGETQGIAYSLNDLGVLARDTGDSVAARAFLAESLAIRRDLAASHGLAQSLDNLGIVERDEGNYGAAHALHEEALALLRAQGDRKGSARALVNLAAVTHRTGDDVRAHMLCRESLRIARDLGDTDRIAECLRLLAGIAAQDERLRAARLWAASTALRAAIGMRLPPIDQAYDDRVMDAARASCTESVWTAAWEEGQHMDLEQAIRFAFLD